MKTWNQDVKSKIRTQLMKASRKGEFVSKFALMMPAQTCYCVKEALKAGIFNSKTVIFAIEREKDVAEIIREELKGLGFENFVVIDSEMTSIKPEKIKKLMSLLAFTKGIQLQEFDYVYLDLMGTSSRSNQDWFEGVLSSFINFKTQVAITFENTDRTKNCRWEPDIEYKFSEREVTNRNAQTAAEMVLYSLCDKGKRIIKYGRCYRNKNGAPMLTFLTGFGWSQKEETYKRAPYDLGYA